MTYRALYREWRPQNFSDMVGQRHVTQTLLNALKQGKIAHAYLFSGPRGTGKTTAAKVLAKALNCEQNPENEPCNQCPSCLGVEQGNSMEVYEIDAASNRGIDEIRDLREKVKLSTAQGKYKVYIIDEVHMLTTEAFNALLKTLEEPPARVVFVLATTEVHKIPVTILSRVQRFEFHRIATTEIEARLAQVCESLNRRVMPEALTIIAQKSEGGLRDALSILDQCLLQDGDIGAEHVYDVLGMVGEDFSSKLTEALLASDYGEVINLLTTGIHQGKDPRQILRELLEYLRGAMLYAATSQDPVVPIHLKETFIRQSKEIGVSRLLKWISTLLEGEGQLKYAANARLAAELLLIKTIYEGENQALENNNSKQQEQEIVAKLPKAAAIPNNPKGKPPTINERSNQSQDQTQIDANHFSPTDLTIDKVLENWPQVLEQVKKEKRSTHAFLIEAKPAQIKDKTINMVFREGFSFHRDKMNQPENKQTVEKVLKTIYGVDVKVISILENELVLEADQDSASSENSLISEEEVLIRKAGEIFGKEFVKVRQ